MEIAEKCEMPYYEVSAAEGTNVIHTFNLAIETAYNHKIEKKLHGSSVLSQ